MTTRFLRLVTFGKASALTRDLICGPYVEISVWDSREPVI